MSPHPLHLDAGARAALWSQVTDAVERQLASLGDAAVAPPVGAQDLRDYLAQVDFDRPLAPGQAVDHAVQGLRRYLLHTGHPRSFGLFNPTPSTMGVAADALVAAFNPQLAAWGHAPFAVEVEQRLLREFAAKAGFDPSVSDGTFTSGGAEANHTAVLCALTRAIPDFCTRGLAAASGAPTLYVSAESHHSFVKAARACGLGTDAVRRIPVDAQLRMRMPALEAAVAEDRTAGRLPCLVVGTAGSTSAGAIDPLGPLAAFAAREDLWFHVDAAYGGAALLLPELAPALDGLSSADSVTLDAHKWLSVPMAAGMVLLRERGWLARAFAITTDYVPPNAVAETVDPYAHSMQWSRRFIGLKLYLSLAVAGWAGYAEVLRGQIALADRLRARLSASGWELDNDTPLPVLCFSDPGGADPARIAQRVCDTGRAWLSATRIGPDAKPVLRACVTSFLTEDADVEALVEALHDARWACAGGEVRP